MNNVNENYEKMGNFRQDVQNFHPEAEVVCYKDSHNIIGVKLPGVSGKTTSLKDESGKPYYSETSYKGSKTLNRFNNEVMRKHR
jgi:hypothetical protein